MTSKIFTSTRSGDLIFGLLDLGRASFDLEAVSLFLDGVYEGGGEGAHRLGAPVKYFSLRGPELFLRTPWRGCDNTTFMCVLQA